MKKSRHKCWNFDLNEIDADNVLLAGEDVDLDLGDAGAPDVVVFGSIAEGITPKRFKFAY